MEKVCKILIIKNIRKLFNKKFRIKILVKNRQPTGYYEPEVNVSKVKHHVIKYQFSNIM